MKQDFKEWTQLMCCPTLSPKEKVVIGNILRISNIGTWKYISHDYLVKVTKVSLSTLKRILKSLEKRELIVTVVVPKKNSREHYNNYIPQIETITSLINQKVNLNHCSFSGFDCSEYGKSLEINGLDTQEISMGQIEPLIKRNKNKRNNNNYNNSTSRYMVSVNENSKKYVKTEVVSIPTNDNLTDGTLNYVCSRDGLIEDAIATIPTAQDTTPMRTLREADEWEYRQSKDGCWKQTMDKELTRLGKTPTEDDMRKLCNSIYKDWETRNEAKNKRTLDEMVQYAFTRYGIALQPKKKKQSNFGKPMHNTNRPTTTEISNMSVGNLSKNVDILERLELASKDCMVFIDTMNKCIEYLIATRKPTISVCKVWFNALHIIQTDGDKMSDNRLNYACDTMDALRKAIHDCGGEDIMNSLQNDEYSHLFKVA